MGWRVKSWYQHLAHIEEPDSVVIVDIVMILTLLYEDYRRKRIERAESRVQKRWEGLESEAGWKPKLSASLSRSRRLPQPQNGHTADA